MPETLISVIGLIAASLTTIAFLPQAIKTWKTKSTDDLSPAMFTLLCSGILLWLIYGILIHDLPIILANGVTICLASIILFYIFKPSQAKKIEHIAIWTNNLEEMKDFYCDVFDAKAGRRYHNPAKRFTSYFLVLSSGARIELMNKGVPALNNSWGHISISVGSKHRVDELTHKVEKKGVEIASYPRSTGDGYYESVIKDPEGNLVEITI
ncbi:MAG TPA: hypothetical protein DDX98_02525 [Bacteroidales bacterium]|jgi:lactoylglutathione lyase|nr:hypothetical protein [Bacteroidales bacterium]